MRLSLLSGKAVAGSSNALPKAAQMRINCENVGKRFHREWIFRNINVEFKPNEAYAITGPNGSGKSTFLQLLAGALIASTGKVHYHSNGGNDVLPEEEVFKQVSIAAPYL